MGLWWHWSSMFSNQTHLVALRWTCVGTRWSQALILTALLFSAFDLELWPTTLTFELYLSRLGHGWSQSAKAKIQGPRSNSSSGRALTDKQTLLNVLSPGYVPAIRLIYNMTLQKSALPSQDNWWSTQKPLLFELLVGQFGIENVPDPFRHQPSRLYCLHDVRVHDWQMACHQKWSAGNYNMRILVHVLAVHYNKEHLAA